jgi:hypothetical protein
MSIASVGQAASLVKQTPVAPTAESAESKAEEAGETAAQEASEGGGATKAATPAGTGLVLDIQA